MDGQVKIYEYPGMTVRVYRPDLSQEERKKRMETIYKAAEALVKDQRGRK